MTPSPIDRRSFLAAGLGALAPAAAPPAPRLLDLHVHLFGLGDGGTGCRMSKAITTSWVFLGLVAALGLRKRGKTVDEEYERALVEHVEGSGLTAAAVLGQDAVYTRGKADWDKTSFYVPNDYVFAVVARHPRQMIPCPSINPDRGDALQELARCHEKGARLFKIHPPTQGVDVADRKHTRFFRRCADLGLVVMVHTGHEHSAPVIDKHLAGPAKLELALDQGCTVVACHSGSGWETDKPDQLPEFLNLLRRYKNLWGDTAVLGTAGRVRDFGRLLADPLARSRLLHGSDFPFPVAPRKYADRIGAAAAARIAAEKSWLRQDFDLKEALGIGRASAHRAYQVARVGTP
ncbi:MAG: amidohydrolase family protein [Gemmataceae bacterium]